MSYWSVMFKFFQLLFRKFNQTRNQNEKKKKSFEMRVIFSDQLIWILLMYENDAMKYNQIRNF